MVGLAVVVGVAITLLGGNGEQPPAAVDRAAAVPAADGPQETTVAFPAADGLRLGGTLRVPGDGAPTPAALVIPGFGPTTRDGIEAPGAVPDLLYRDVAHMLSDAGVASLRYDKRGTGASPLVDGQLTFDDLLTDAQAALDLLSERVDVDPDAIAVVGHDEGGLVALRLAASDPRVRGAVLVSTPGRPLAEVLADDLRASADDPAHAEAHVRDLQAVVDGLLADGDVPAPASLPGALRPVFPAGEATYLRQLFAFDPAEAAADVDVPVLIVRGGRAPGVSAVDAERLQRALAGEVTTLVGEEADHTLTLPEDADFRPLPGRGMPDQMHDPTLHNREVAGISRDDDLLARVGTWVASLLGVRGAQPVDPPPADDTVTVTVTARAMTFDPAMTELRAGRHEFVLVNEDTTEHDMELAVAGAHDDHLAGVRGVAPGERDAFVVDLEPGTYELACHLPGHFEAGMVATVVVR